MKNILFFTAPYCSACKVLKPKVEQMAAQSGAQIINIDISQAAGKESANNAGVTVLPTVVVIDNGNTQLARWDGGISTIEKELPAVLGNVVNAEGGILTPQNLIIAAGVGALAFAIYKNQKKRRKEYADEDN